MHGGCGGLLEKDSELVALQLETCALWLLLTDGGDARQVEYLQESFVGIDLAVAVFVVGIGISFTLCTCLTEDIKDILGR